MLRDQTIPNIRYGHLFIFSRVALALPACDGHRLRSRDAGPRWPRRWVGQAMASLWLLSLPNSGGWT